MPPSSKKSPPNQGKAKASTGLSRAIEEATDRAAHTSDAGASDSKQGDASPAHNGIVESLPNPISDHSAAVSTPATETTAQNKGRISVTPSVTSSPSQIADWPDATYHQTVILGAGLSGLAIAIQLKRKGYGDDFVILDRESDVAGTWTANTYPGAGSDVPSPLFCYSFKDDVEWSTFFPKQKELKRYFCSVTAQYDLQDRLHLQTVVKEARFDECTNLWHVYTEDLPGRKGPGVTPARHHYVSKLFVSAVGGLSQPNECNIPGHENFGGALFHSACWDHSVPLKERNVVVIGNGSSATQFVPELAKECKNVTQIVRSQHWMELQPKSPFRHIPGWKWLVKRFVFMRKLQRFLIWAVMESFFIGTYMNPIGAAWRSLWARKCIKHANKVAPKEYLHQIIPDKNKLPPLHKRRILDDGYLECLNRSNVHLETRKAVRIEKDTVVLASGEKVPADVIILATGFTTARAGFPMALYGRKGEEVRQHWEKYGDSGPIHYRSTFLAGYPNLVTLNGTNSATGHMSLIYTTENQVLLALEVARPLLDGRRPSREAIDHDPTVLASQSLSTFTSTPSFEVKLAAELNEQNWIQWLMKKRVFSVGTGSWYINQQSGRVTAMHPDWQWKLFLRCIFPNWQDFVYRNLDDGRPYPNRTWWKVWGNTMFGIGTVPSVSAQDAGLKSCKPGSERQLEESSGQRLCQG